MKVETFVCNYLYENCYVVSFDYGEGFIVDCGVRMVATLSQGRPLFEFMLDCDYSLTEGPNF